MLNFINYQVAKIKGAANVVGICGSETKCNFLKEQLGFNGTINYKTDDIYAALRKLCPNGVDCYFDNVGGDISDHIIRQMNKNSYIAVCGQVANYNRDVPFRQDLAPDIAGLIKEKMIHREFFAVSNYKGNIMQV